MINPGGCARPTSSTWSVLRLVLADRSFSMHYYMRLCKSVKANKRRDSAVVLPWWVAALAFVFGALLGAMVAAVLIEDEKELRR